MSILIPSKDDPRIEGILSQLAVQENDQVEVILIFNGSKDAYVKKTKELCQRLSTSSFFKVYTISEAGIPKAYNCGIVKSRGKVIVLLTSDLILPKSYIECLVKYCQAEQDSLAITKGLVYFQPQDSIFSRYNCRLRQISYHKHKQLVYAPNLIISRKVFYKAGMFWEGVRYCEDSIWGDKAKLHGFSIREFPQLKVMHIDDKHIRKTILTIFNYGIGRAYRVKRNYLINNHTKATYLRQLFANSSTHLGHKYVIYNLFVEFVHLVRNIGVCYGILFKFRRYNYQHFQEELYYNSFSNYLKNEKQNGFK